MTRSVLVAYQLLTGLSDTSTGLLLVAVPAWTLHLMGLHVDPIALPFIAYIGAFVLSVGLACLYGARLATQIRAYVLPEQLRLETVWLLTGLTRSLVAIFVLAKVVSGALEPGWLTVACTDGALAILQCIGLARGWARHVEP